jgi:tyrosinase
LKYNGSYYSYTYSDLSLTSYDTIQPSFLKENLSLRLNKLSATNLETGIKMANKQNNELVGASSGSITLKDKETKATVQLDKSAWKSVKNSLLKASVSNIPDEVYLQLEGVKGGDDSNFLSVYINQTFIKSVSLFGLLGASMKNTAHGGSGLTFKFNITSVIDELHLESAIDINSLDVQIKSKEAPLDGNEITVERIGIYRSGQ